MKNKFAILMVLPLLGLASCGETPAASSSTIVSVEESQRQNMAQFLGKAVSKTVGDIGTCTIENKLSGFNAEVNTPSVGSVASTKSTIKNFGFDLSLGVKDLFSTNVDNVKAAAKITKMGGEFDLDLSSLFAQPSLETSCPDAVKEEESSQEDGEMGGLTFPTSINTSFADVALSAYLDNNIFYADLSDKNLGSLLLEVGKIMMGGGSVDSSADQSGIDESINAMIDGILGTNRKIIFAENLLEDAFVVPSFIYSEQVLVSALLQQPVILELFVRYADLRETADGGVAMGITLSKTLIENISTSFGLIFDSEECDKFDATILIKFDASYRLTTFALTNVDVAGTTDGYKFGISFSNELNINYGVAPTMPESFADYLPLAIEQ